MLLVKIDKNKTFKNHYTYFSISFYNRKKSIFFILYWEYKCDILRLNDIYVITLLIMIKL